MKKKILLVGCGNIGSRHLQALSKLKGYVTVDIVENYPKSIKLAKSRLDEIQYNKKQFKFQWHKNFQTLDGSSDLVIIATLSEGRVALVEKLLKMGYSRFLLEKLVCQSTNEYEHLLQLIKEFHAKGWVNTRCRYFKSYQKIKQFYKNPTKFSLNVISGDTGLSTGAIHYIDLFSWISNSKEIKLNGDLLFDEIYKNKRGKDFVEFGGTIVGSTKKKSSFTISYFPGKPSLIVSISDGNHQIIIDEYNEKILYSDFKKFDFKLENVSTLTTNIVNDILSNDSCLLPTINYSFNHHSEIFKIFSLQLEKIKNKKLKKCPIT